MRVRRLIYTSRVARQVRYADAEAIAEAATERNQQAGITGLLLYTPSHFIQVLEGEHTTLSQTVDRIRHDARHASLRIVDDREVDAREFDSWAMAARYCSAHPTTIEQLDTDGALELLRAARDEGDA